MLFVLRLEDGSDAARRSPCEGGLAIHTGLLDLSLGHDHGDVSDPITAASAASTVSSCPTAPGPTSRQPKSPLDRLQVR